MAKSFTAELLPVPHGGHYVVVPKAIAAAAGLRHGQRVRGTVSGARYRSSLMMYGGVFHLGVHKATLAEAEVRPPAAVQVSIEADTEPLPTDAVPPDLAKALKRSTGAAAAWERLRPSLRREHVKSLLDAKKADTRSRRLEKILADARRVGRGRTEVAMSDRGRAGIASFGTAFGALVRVGRGRCRAARSRTQSPRSRGRSASIRASRARTPRRRCPRTGRCRASS